MANNEMWDAPGIVPSITYADVPRAIEWLERVFGFRERKEARLTWPGGGMTWIEAGNGLFNISTPDETWQLPRTGASGSVIKVYVEDVDRHCDRAKAKGPRLFPSHRTDSGVVGSTAPWITKGTDGRFRSVVAISRPSAGNYPLV